MESREKKLQLLHRQSGGGATSKKDRFDLAARDCLKAPIKVEEDRIEKRLCLVAIRSFFIKAAVRTNLRTKRNVDIEVMQFRGLLDSVLDLHKLDYNPASCSEL